ncbi:tetratricopeptide repeat-like superfamily protein, partial [Tanacetum coccineum]
NTVIDSLCKDKMIDDAFKLFKEMVFQRGISSDVITYNCLIDGLCNLGRWEVASKMLQEMLDVGISPNVHTFNILVDAFCKDGRVEEAEDVINIMLDRGIVPDIVTWNGDRSGTGSRYGIAVRYFLKFGTTGGRLISVRFGSVNHIFRFGVPNTLVRRTQLILFSFI